MATYMIGYDLNKPGKDYESVFQAIKGASNGVWCHCLDSTWLIKTNLNANQIYEKIRPCIDNNDNIIIMEIRYNWAGQLPQKQIDYINNSIFA